MSDPGQPSIKVTYWSDLCFRFQYVSWKMRHKTNVSEAGILSLTGQVAKEGSDTMPQGIRDYLTEKCSHHSQCHSLIHAFIQHRISIYSISSTMPDLGGTKLNWTELSMLSGLCGSDGKRICLKCKRPKFDPWFGKIPWKRKCQPTLVILPGEFHG